MRIHWPSARDVALVGIGALVPCAAALVTSWVLHKPLG